jgi:PAS domain-containing protein
MAATKSKTRKKLIEEIEALRRHIAGAADLPALDLLPLEQLLADTIFENVRDGVLVTDRNRTILAVNPAFSAITGYAPDEVVGKTPAVLKSDRHSR